MRVLHAEHRWPAPWQAVLWGGVFQDGSSLAPLCSVHSGSVTMTYLDPLWSSSILVLQSQAQSQCSQLEGTQVVSSAVLQAWGRTRRIVLN